MGMMKDSITIEIDEKSYVEIYYECWGEGAWIDYDQPPDPSGHEVQKIELHIGENVIDVTEIADDLASALDYDNREEKLIEQIQSK